jgi:cysteine dioxygenase
METIISEISEKGFKSTAEVLGRYTSNDWMKYVTINPNHYHRSKVFENEDFEIIVLTWNKNQGSCIHDHALNGCYMLVLQGELYEELYDKDLNHHSARVVETGEITYIDNTIGLHRIMNQYPDVVVSLHVYSPPNHPVNLIG